LIAGLQLLLLLLCDDCNYHCRLATAATDVTDCFPPPPDRRRVSGIRDRPARPPGSAPEHQPWPARSVRGHCIFQQPASSVSPVLFRVSALINATAAGWARREIRTRFSYVEYLMHASLGLLPSRPAAGSIW